MQLVKNNRVSADRFVRVLDGAPLPDGPILLTAERFLADATDLASRPGAVGVIWPNNRKVSELEPYLDWLAVVALVFPKFQDGRAYSQARQLREQYGFHGELRATGDVLRDQRLFLLRAGFDAFEVKKDTDVKSFVEQQVRYSVVYQPAGDTRVSALRRRSAEHRAVEKVATDPQPIMAHF